MGSGGLKWRSSISPFLECKRNSLTQIQLRKACNLGPPRARFREQKGGVMAQGEAEPLATRHLFPSHASTATYGSAAERRHVNSRGRQPAVAATGYQEPRSGATIAVVAAKYCMARCHATTRLHSFLMGTLGRSPTAIHLTPLRGWNCGSNFFGSGGRQRAKE